MFDEMHLFIGKQCETDDFTDELNGNICFFFR